MKETKEVRRVKIEKMAIPLTVKSYEEMADLLDEHQPAKAMLILMRDDVPQNVLSFSLGLTVGEALWCVEVVRYRIMEQK